MSFRHKILKFSFLAALGGHLSCSAEHKRGLNPDQIFTDTKQQQIQELLAEPEKIVFSEIHARVIQPKCMNCHSAENRKDNVSLSTYQDLFGANGTKTVVMPSQPLASKLYDVVQQPPSSSRHMPPLKSNKAPLNEQEKKLLYAWIENGAKEHVDQIVEAALPLREELSPYFDDPKTIDYKIVNKYVFEQACNTCHSRNGLKAQEDTDAWQFGADMTNYKSLTDDETNALFGLEPNLIKGVPAKSRIYIEAAVNQSMPPRKSYDPLDAFRVKLLRLWILNCAIEDYATSSEAALIENPKPRAEKIRDCQKLEEINEEIQNEENK